MPRHTRWTFADARTKNDGVTMQYNELLSYVLCQLI